MRIMHSKNMQCIEEIWSIKQKILQTWNLEGLKMKKSSKKFLHLQRCKNLATLLWTARWRRRSMNSASHTLRTNLLNSAWSPSPRTLRLRGISPRFLEAATLALESVPIPQSFKCPITLEVMEDPVVTVGGHVYKRSHKFEATLHRTQTRSSTGNSHATLTA